jgi:hypothetical protein
MAFDGTEASEIDIETASAWTENYRDANSEATRAHFFGRDIIEEILSQTGCVGIRIYYALDEKGAKQLIIVGANSSENDLYNGVIAERSFPCPTYCDQNSSPLNA